MAAVGYSSVTAPVRSNQIVNGDDRFWRDEVVSRVEQHRARRRRRFDPHATLELDLQPGVEFPPSTPEQDRSTSTGPAIKHEPPKIIEFPRPAAVAYVPQSRQEPDDLELAEPVLDSPRILYAPEPQPLQMDFPPAFADIQLEAEENRREFDDPPLRPAPVTYRLFSGLVDLVFVLLATVLFTGGMVMFASTLPPTRLSMLYGVIVCGSLWVIYQYLFLVYSSGTPGMHLAQLELCTFKGNPAPRSLRRYRAFASALSALAVGLGFVWVLLDEDTLGWHDRITQTHLRKSGS